MFSREYLSVFSLAAVMAVRMLGLFLILPVFSMHAFEFAHASHFLIGLTLGIYGLTQALLQIPLGILSDKIGRKPVMSLGLIVFITGSVCAALSHSIGGLMIGRALQGAGAIGSTVLAMVADLTSEESRSKAMGIMGFAIGISFAIAMILSPLLDEWIGLSGIFWACAILAVLAEGLIWVTLPNSRLLRNETPNRFKFGFKAVLTNLELLRLDAGIFFLHAILTAVFIAIPIILTQEIHLSSKFQTYFYLLTLILAFALMLPAIIIAEKKHLMKIVFLSAIIILLFTQLSLLFFPVNFVSMSSLLILFFTAFSLLEAILPSWISKIAPIDHKGAAMGCYSTAQFLGIFAGGALGGYFYTHFGVSGIFILGSLLTLFWLLIASSLKPAPALKKRTNMEMG